MSVALTNTIFAYQYTLDPSNSWQFNCHFIFNSLCYRLWESSTCVFWMPFLFPIASIFSSLCYLHNTYFTQTRRWIRDRLRCYTNAQKYMHTVSNRQMATKMHTRIENWRIIHKVVDHKVIYAKFLFILVCGLACGNWPTATAISGFRNQ